ARGGDKAERSGQTVDLGRLVHVAQKAAGRSACCTRYRIDLDLTHEREVEQKARTNCEAGNVVAPTLDREWNVVVAGKVDGGDDVAHVEAANDEGRTAVDHGVPDRTGFVIGR